MSRHELTERQREVLKLVADDNRSLAIAAKLGISVKGVDGHISAFLDKLGVEARAGAVAKALRQNILDGKANH